MTNIEVVKSQIGKRGYLNSSIYREAMINMRFESFTIEDTNFFIDYYKTVKDIFSRNQILQAFVLQCQKYDLKEFFLSAFKKERYLDMRLTAIRGYAIYASEKEISPLMKKFIDILVKIPSRTPYNYQEYEMLRSKFGLPYLVEQYRYDCFKEALDQLEKQYNDMPDECKGFFTLDENGIYVALMTREEIDENLDVLFKRK
ncbi:hypothetical protein [Romboutsia lituseburensis]|uniref:Uncharacterized protein n=1 Tax=Romboutsia lituseburensis DSM 797 TaxID=1121325 RepID=A0A1G9MJP3_9FIRM|nr:hypothetical protein [Romboutsia lituseburensis]CEH34423.1 Hypothetical protein RLITU_1835 [Romboutsia lituseburensis]SDL74506.1 hypothetical protein SAMN04515677_103253 [Romboutsia lituseburensis DSM 797]